MYIACLNQDLRDFRIFRMRAGADSSESWIIAEDADFRGCSLSESRIIAEDAEDADFRKLG